MNPKSIEVITKKNNLFFYLPIIFLLILTTTSIKSFGKENIVWQYKYDYIGITHSDAKNDHPVNISPDEMYDLLGSIRVTKKSNNFVELDDLIPFSDDKEESGSADISDNGKLAPPSNSVFNRDELRKLSKPISLALSQLSPTEDIVFSITGSHDNYIGKSQQTTSARLFYQSNQLHIIFGEFQVNIEKKYRRKGNTSTVPEKISTQDLKSFRLKVGSRKKASKLPVNFLLSQTHQMQTKNGTLRKDWLKIDLEKFRQAVTEKQQREIRKENVAEETGQLQQKTREINQEQEQLKQKVDRLERILEAKEKANAQSTSPSSEVIKKSLEDRLSQLKNIYEQGHISEEIYNEKVRELLKEL